MPQWNAATALQALNELTAQPATLCHRCNGRKASVSECTVTSPKLRMDFPSGRFKLIQCIATCSISARLAIRRWRRRDPASHACSTVATLSCETPATTACARALSWLST